jgi:hypothetical protein
MLNSEEATSDPNERRTAARIERTYYSVLPHLHNRRRQGARQRLACAVG